MTEYTHLMIGLLPYACWAAAVAIWSLQWPRVKGTIEISVFDQEWTADTWGSQRTVEKQGKFYLLYSYSVGGSVLQGTRLAPLAEFKWQLSGSPDLGSAHDEAQWYRKGAMVDVYYCPLYPQWACLEPGGFLIVGMFGVVGLVLHFVA